MVHVEKLGGWLRQAAQWAWPPEGLLIKVCPLHVLLKHAR